MADAFRKGKFELIALTETKLKGNREVSWCGVNGIIDSVQEIEKPREGMTVLCDTVGRLTLDYYI